MARGARPAWACACSPQPHVVPYTHPLQTPRSWRRVGRPPPSNGRERTPQPARCPVRPLRTRRLGAATGPVPSLASLGGSGNSGPAPLGRSFLLLEGPAGKTAESLKEGLPKHRLQRATAPGIPHGDAAWCRPDSALDLKTPALHPAGLEGTNGDVSDQRPRRTAVSPANYQAISSGKITRAEASSDC